MSAKPKKLTYTFRFANGVEKSFSVTLDRASLGLVAEAHGEIPEWAKLEFHQCPNCPLNPAEHPYCPIARNLVEPMGFFRHVVSIEEAEISITNEHREVRKHAAVQYGVSSLMGVYMVTSGCPVMDKLRPMVYTHLPFASVDETLYRAVAMYLVAQFLRHKRGQEADWELSKLVQIYEEVGMVNRHFIKRLLSIGPKDASLNALGSLDCFASYNSVSLMDNFFEDLEEIFAIYMGEKAASGGKSGAG